MRVVLEKLQPLGRALMLPIAVLPIAGLLLRFGQPDLLATPFIAAAGDAIFSNLGLLFAIGVAVGLAKDNNGAAGLAGAVCFLIATKGAIVVIQNPALADPAKAIAKLSVPMGILSGLIAGQFYNRFHQVKLPDYLAFFAGRRFVPILSGLAGLGLAAVFGYSWAFLDHSIDEMSRAVLGLGPIGLLLYGVLNRVLIITGLHHIINNLAWFILGSYGGATGDLNRFFAGDPTAGVFMSGFFPVMMFGLPAACLAMYQMARPEKKTAVGGMLLSMALTSFLTGVTEPIEFSFIFLAPVLYALHALLTGIAFMVMALLQVRLGFSFSAGLLDYLINFKLAGRPLLLLPVGAGYFALYYGLFRLFIAKFDLKTPGREADAEVSTEGGFLGALGGQDNLTAIDACTTRLRLMVVDQSKVDEAALRALGAKGFVRPSEKALQVVLGPIADQVAGELRAAWSGAGGKIDTAALKAALGGAGNLASVELRDSRLLVVVKDEAKAAEKDILAAAPRGAVKTAPSHWHILVGPDADGWAKALA